MRANRLSGMSYRVIGLSYLSEGARGSELQIDGAMKSLAIAACIIRSLLKKAHGFGHFLHAAQNDALWWP